MKILHITTKVEEYPMAGDNKKHLEIVEGQVILRYIPQYIHVVKTYTLVILGLKIILYRKRYDKPYLKLINNKTC